MLYKYAPTCVQNGDYIYIYMLGMGRVSLDKLATVVCHWVGLLWEGHLVFIVYLFILFYFFTINIYYYFKNIILLDR